MVPLKDRGTAPPVRPAADRTAFTHSLPRAPQSARVARGLVSSALRAWGADAVEDTAWLVVTELVSNAVVHTGVGSVRLTVTRRDERCVRIAVADRSRRVPRSFVADPGDESGRGLSIVAALCGGRWGVDRLSRGKCVWAELPAAAERPR
ncbi:ATP-binding protein [Streptomyces sp. NPDC127068]|uniref:ATP-binding protein n=1 Tax=Streptomyces sp. NPDC127068 TaxID=3347127 RepID=UPI003655AB17